MPTGKAGRAGPDPPVSFEFATTPRIAFGPGVSARAGEWARGLGRRAFLVCGSRSLERAGRLDAVERALAAAGIASVRHAVSGEPDTELVDRAVALAREAETDLVVGVGGGSALDAAKAVAGLLANGGASLDYLEVVGGGRAFER